MRFRLLVQEFLPVAMILVVLAGLYHFDLGIVRAVVGAWGDALGIRVATSPHAMPSLLDDGVCFAVVVLFLLLASFVVPLEDGCSRLLGRIKGISVNEHVSVPMSLALLGLAAWHTAFHDTGTVRGMIVLAVDGLKWLAPRVNGSYAAPPLSHTHPPCPCDLNPLVNAPCDAIALGVIMAMILTSYLGSLQLLWEQRKRSPSLSSVQEL